MSKDFVVQEVLPLCETCQKIQARLKVVTPSGVSKLLCEKCFDDENISADWQAKWHLIRPNENMATIRLHGTERRLRIDGKPKVSDMFNYNNRIHVMVSVMSPSPNELLIHAEEQVIK